jgi:hypothetical protein
MFDANRWRVSAVRKQFTRWYIVNLFGTGDSGNVSLNSFWQTKLSKNEMPGCFRQGEEFLQCEKNLFHRVQWCMHSLFSSCLMQTGEEFLQCENDSPRNPCIWTHSGKLSKNEMPGSVRQWTLDALVKKKSLHFDCWKTTDRIHGGYF